MHINKDIGEPPKISGNKKKFVTIAVILSVIIGSIAFVSTHNTNAKADTKSYTAAKVVKGKVEYFIEGNGIIQPGERYALKTWSGGTVTEVFVTEGTAVTKGQPLMTIVNDALNSTVKQSTLEWSIALNDLNDMYNNSDEDDYSRRAAELKVEQCEIALQEACEARDNLLIKTPFGGVLLDNNLQLGQKATAGTIAASFATANQFELVTSFSGSDLSSISEGQEAIITVAGINKTYSGAVTEVAFVGDSTSGKYEVIVSVDNPDDSLRQGMNAYCSITILRDIEQDIFLLKGANGYLRYVRQEDVISASSGKVVEIYYQPGDFLKENEPIARLINDDLERQIKSAQLQLDSATEELAKILYPDKDTILAQELKVEQAYQKVVDASERLESLNVVSPIDGVVTSISVSVGDELGEDTSSSGQELIVVCNFSKTYLEISVDELDINKIAFAQNASISIDALPETEASGKVIGIAQEGVSTNGVATYPVTIEIDYVSGIKGGMSASAQILLDKRENVLVVPSESIISNNGQDMIRVLSDGQVILKPVQTGLDNKTLVEIVEGLSMGEQIIVAYVSPDTKSNQFIPGSGTGGFPMGGEGPSPGLGSNSGSTQRRN